MVRQSPPGFLKSLLDRPLPTPPERLRVGPFRRGTFRSQVRSARLTSRVGLALGIAFGICFLTGLISHFHQHPVGWLPIPSRPVWLFRVTQGLHVATGLAAIPLLAVKLWSVYPKLFAWPPARNVVHAIERLSLLLLVSAALFQLVTGVLNISLWYAPMPFFFPVAHYWTAWVAIGSILLHVAVKLPVIQRSLARSGPDIQSGGISRRGLLTATGLAALTITAATAGQTVPGLTWLSRLAPRRPNVGPQGIPVNQTASGAGVISSALDSGWRLLLHGPNGSRELSLDDLRALPQHTASLPIACVEGWSASATWTGVRVIDLLALIGHPDPTGHHLVVESLQKISLYRMSTVEGAQLRDPLTLLALRLNGEPLHLDHGFPVRLIAPDRPGVLQTKWVNELRLEPL